MGTEEADTNVEICSGSSCGEDRRVPFHLEVYANSGIRCDQFLQNWPRWLDSGSVTFWVEWKKLVAEFGESVYYGPAVARAVACGMQPQLKNWSAWAPRTHRQHSHHDDNWSRQSSRVSMDEL